VSEEVSTRARDALTLLRLDQARWQAVLDAARDAIVSIDQNGIVTLFNRTAEEIFGYSASEVLGENVRMLMPPPYQEEHDQYLENYRKTRVAKGNRANPLRRGPAQERGGLPDRAVRFRGARRRPSDLHGHHP
jgi:PAS domain-containing protein